MKPCKLCGTLLAVTYIPYYYARGHRKSRQLPWRVACADDGCTLSHPLDFATEAEARAAAGLPT